MGLNTFTIPQKILITSDNNQLKFIKIKKVGKESVFVYRFVFSKTKLNLEFDMTEDFIRKCLLNTFKVIE